LGYVIEDRGDVIEDRGDVDDRLKGKSIFSSCLSNNKQISILSPTSLIVVGSTYPV
jgi:hypothetical protein